MSVERVYIKCVQYQKKFISNSLVVYGVIDFVEDYFVYASTTF